MTVYITIENSPISEVDGKTIRDGFERASEIQNAPSFKRKPLAWFARDASNSLVGALEANVLWDWLYVERLWVNEDSRGTGLGKQLMDTANQFARDEDLIGIWLWTQSWQAKGFYLKLGFQEFITFSDFPRGHSRIGLRKYLAGRDNR